MATLPTSLFFKGNKIYGIGTLKFDLLLSEDHNFDNTVTEHPVEDGSIIADHIQNELENGSLTGLISNFSIQVEGITGNRAQDAFEILVDLWKSKQLFTITTIHRTYTDVGILSMPISRDTESAESIIIQCSFRKVNVVKLQSVVIEAEINLSGLNTSTQKQVSPQVDVGRSVGNPSEVAVAP